MNSLRRALVLLAVAVVAMLSSLIAMPTAHAATDIVENLEVTYAVRADGTIRVTYVLEWNFGETGRRGIEFGIATREPWELDATRDVLYDVTNIEVSSPSGAPDLVTTTESGSGSRREITLRIGDPEQTLDTDRATYEISYDLAGGLRTFDDVPELNLDVTSADYPTILAFSITVLGPDGVERARCLVGDRECEQRVTDGVATLSGSNAIAGRTITAVAAFPAGSIAGAEPNLENRALVTPALIEQDSRFTVDSDAMMHVEHTLAYLLPTDAEEHNFFYSINTRRPHSIREDQVFEISNLTAHDGDGNALEVTLDPGQEEDSFTSSEARVRLGSADNRVTIVLSYDVVGAITSSGGSAHLRWAATQLSARPELRGSWTWRLPGEVVSLECLHLSNDGNLGAGCTFPGDVTVDGSTVTLTQDADQTSWMSGRIAHVQFPAGSVGSVRPILEPSRNFAKSMERVGATAVGLGALLGMVFLGRRVTRPRAGHDERFTSVPPGVDDPDGPVGRTAREHPVPVQFHPPDLDLVTAGLILDGQFDARHTAAALTQMAVTGSVQLQSRPLNIRRADVARVTNEIERDIYSRIPAATSGQIGEAAIRSLNQAVDAGQTRAADESRFFQFAVHDAVRGTRRASLFGVVTLVLAFGVGMYARAQESLVVTGLAVGLGVGAAIVMLRRRTGDKPPRRALSATGTAQRDQIRGFRTFIATAEAGQLNFEAEQDVFRRYLPWAVLYGLTERWTKVCERLAAAGLIAPLDTSFAGGATPLDITRSLGSLQQRASTAALTAPVRRTSSSSSGGGWSSGGGSGGRSGFSSGSRGGSGGGGTRSRSW